MQDQGASVPDQATQAPPEAAEASSPSGECPSRKVTFPDVRSTFFKRGDGNQQVLGIRHDDEEYPGEGLLRLSEVTRVIPAKAVSA